jgi:hypothetical protein
MIGIVQEASTYKLASNYGRYLQDGEIVGERLRWILQTARLIAVGGRRLVRCLLENWQCVCHLADHRLAAISHHYKPDIERRPRWFKEAQVKSRWLALRCQGGGVVKSSLLWSFAAFAALFGAITPTWAAAPTKLATIILPEDQEIQVALEAGPEHLRAGATVYVFRADGYHRVRVGTNGFNCLVNRDGNQAGDNDLKPTCWDAEGSKTILPVMLRVGELIAGSASAEEIKKDIDAGFASGRFSSPKKPGIAYMLRGDLLFDPTTRMITKANPPAHYMIYAPGITGADIGMERMHPTSGYGLPLVYNGYSGGIRTAYIIVPAASGAGQAH